MWTKERIYNLIQTDDRVLYGAILQLYKRQTDSEKIEGTARYRNGVGFNALDANFMCSLARYYQKNGYLTYNQKNVARKKITKYTNQLTRIANKEI